MTLRLLVRRQRALIQCMLHAIENLGYDHFARIDARIYYQRYSKRWRRLRKRPCPTRHL